METSSVEACTGRSFPTSLLSALFEWLLIIMLFFNSIFSFFITKCAHFWKLRTPCLLCSRLDHVFGSEKRGFIWKLICGNHKKEISSLVLCHAHNKLVNVHEMCESCLFSFATINKSNAETYRLLVGKLGEDPYPFIDRDPLLGDRELDTLSKRYCSCCDEPCVSSRGLVQTLIQTRSSGLDAADLDDPLLSSVIHCEDDIQESPSKQSMLFGPSHPNETKGDNALSHVQYRGLKITSDTESDGNGTTLEAEHMEPNLISLASNLTSSTKLVEPASAPEPLVLEPLVIIGDALPAIECGVSLGHGLDELTPKQAKANDSFSSPTDLLSLDNTLPPSNTMANSVEVLEESYVARSEEYETECGETEKSGILAMITTSEAGSEAQPVTSDGAQMALNILELGDAYKLAVGTRGVRQLSGKLSEQWIGKDSSRVSEDLKLLFSQLSFNRMNDQSRDMSPRLSINGDEPRNFDVSSAVGMQILQRRITLERNESGLESLDGSIVNEIEGENVVDRLKRQVDHDKKLMSCLYKELEEERNASAIAANQAMAMITRLQEEKATLHMEALQCLRMMEEQSEYDDDALQKANDLINEKDKEIQDLEAELEYYRIKFPNEFTVDNLVATSNVKERDIGVVHLESNQIGSIPEIHEKVGSGGGTYNSLLLEFEDEKLDIMQYLKKLENMLHMFSNNEVSINFGNGEYFGNKGSLSSGADDLDFDKEGSELDCSDRNSLLSLRNEMSNLNKRMEALEVDKNFLEHSINSLRKGEEGLQFVQEIASHLRELRKIGIRS